MTLRSGGFLISKIHQISRRVFARKLKAHGIEEINPAQGRILFVLWQADGLTISELARRTSLGKSTLTSMLDRLEQSGLLKRQPSPSDRRETVIVRTQKDRDLETLYNSISREMTDLYYRGLTDAQVDQFEHCLRKILDNLCEEEENHVESDNKQRPGRPSEDIH